MGPNARVARVWLGAIVLCAAQSGCRKQSSSTPISNQAGAGAAGVVGTMPPSGSSAGSSGARASDAAIAPAGGAPGGGSAAAGHAGGSMSAAGSSGSSGQSAAGSSSPSTGAGGATPPSPATGGSAATSDAGGMQPYKGVANSPCAARTMLNVSWYYNWGQTESEPCSDGRGGAFVPMIWGHTGDEQSATGIANAVKSFVAHGYGYVLGFNEPDNSSQSNIAVDKAISLWPSFDDPAIRIGSPGTAANQNPGQAWFKDFMGKIASDSSLRADFLAIHWYGWNAGSCDAKAAALESYIKWAEAFPGNRPIWITEWGCLNQSAPDTATVVAFYKGAIAMFAKHPRIARYAWYPWSTNLALNNKDGSLTELGMAYASAPAFR